jgi:hypothetical protein
MTKTKQEMTFTEKVVYVQSSLKAPKSQYNSFGKYHYRNAEDILEAVKPLLKEVELILTVSDKTTEVVGNAVVTATATLTDGESKALTVTAQAGVDPNTKGMHIAQCYGSSSSYARKYALNGLFLIDDTKDADATNDHGKAKNSAPSPVSKKPTAEKIWLNENDANWDKAKKYIQGGGNVATLKTKYNISKENETKLTKVNQVL